MGHAGIRTWGQDSNLDFANPEPLDHPIQRPAIDLQDFGSAAHISVAAIDDVKDVLPFDFFQ
jgi:hypothetical protein